MEQFMNKVNASSRVQILQDEELLKEIMAEKLKEIRYRSKSFLFKTHKKYTIRNLIEEEEVR
jgi:hypothetical protein